MNMVEFGYFFAVALIAMILGVRGYRLLQSQGFFRIDTGRAQAAPSTRYM
jgi:hypothetical protein